MYARITIDNVASLQGFSYGDMKFKKYGVFAWEYEGGSRGPVHWVNWDICHIEQDWLKVRPKNYWLWFYPGVLGSIIINTTPLDDIADVLFNNVPVNLLTGAGVPTTP